MRILPIITSLFFAGSLAAADPSPEPNRNIPIRMMWDQKIPLRDGVNLSATIYRDPAVTKPEPCIFTLTPYIGAHAAKQGIYFAQNGYVYAVVDSRGRGNSAGTFVPGQVEAKDGYDAIEWLAKQPFCDGRVVTWGGSWLGFAQWSIAKEFPPHLKAIAPSAAVYPGVDYPQPNGVFMSYMLQWLNYVEGHASNEGVFDSNLWNIANRLQATTGRAFADLETITGATGTVFRTWLAHPREDAFWQAMTPSAAQFAKINLPVLTITGHYDADQLGALTYYERHLANAPQQVTANHWLIIGPWDHSGTRRPKTDLGGIAFGPAAVMSMEALHKAWFDHVLDGKSLPEFLKKPVACFIMGKNQWVYAQTLKEIEGPPLTMALDLAGALAGDIAHTGTLAPKAGAASTVTLISDPKYVAPQREPEEDNPNYLKDQADAYEDQRSRVVLHGAPLAAETVLAGRPRLRLRLAVNQPDADVSVALYEILRDGTSVFLTASNVRLRYRKGGSAPVMMVPNKPELVEFPKFNFFARAIAKGSRLRMIIDTGASTDWQRNTHTGGDLASEPVSAGRVARISVITGPESGSVLELPRPVDGIVK